METTSIYSPGQRVTYWHDLLEETIASRVRSSTKRGVVIEFDDVANGWPRDRRFLTHVQAARVLS